jgi:predicted peroxiredoxin
MKKATKEQQEKIANDLKNKLEEEMKQIESGGVNMTTAQFQQKAQRIEKLSNH